MRGKVHGIHSHGRPWRSWESHKVSRELQRLGIEPEEEEAVGDVEH